MRFAAVADTHATFWYVFGDGRLSKAAGDAIEQAAANGLHVGVSTMSLAEAVYLVEKQRIAPEALARLIEICRDPGNVLAEVPLDSRIVQTMPQIPRAVVPDLPDRVIAATAVLLGVPVITRDHRIQVSGLPSIW